MLVVAAHLYAISVAAPSVVSAALTSGMSPVMVQKQGWLLLPHGGGSSSPFFIMTPVHDYIFSLHVNHSSSSSDDDDGGAGTKKKNAGKNQKQQQEEERSRQQLVLNLLSSDPATMLFDAAQYLMQDRNPPPTPPSSSSSSSSSAEQKARKEDRNISYFKDARLIMLPQMIGLVMLPVLLIPSLVAPAGAMVPGMGSGQMRCSLSKMIMATTSWPVLNACMLCFLVSWGICHWVLYVKLGLYKLAVCSSMHLAARILMGLWSMLYTCPFAPIFLPRVVAGGVGASTSLLLMCIAHIYYAIPYSSMEFYMCHLWASGVVAPVIQATVLRAVLWCFAPTRKGGSKAHVD
jgi:hypothetical protein